MDEYQNKLRNIISTHFTITESSEQGLREAAQLVQDVATSFGGCVKCWGNGYFYESDALNRPELCSCIRGDRFRYIVKCLGDEFALKDA